MADQPSQQVVWKFRLQPTELGDPFLVELPAGVKIVHAGVSPSGPCVYGIVDPTAETVVHTFLVIATGKDLPEGSWTHLGTIMLNGGTMVFHVFHGGQVEAPDVFPDPALTAEA